MPSKLFSRVREDERGAVAVVIALFMVVLLGAAAFSVDVGAMYAERGQLQDGADAAAIGAAQKCARTGTIPCDPVSAATVAQSLANANSNDGASKATVTLAPSGNSVSVTTSTVDGKTGAGSLALSFAPIMGIKTKTVAATAAATWGSPSGGPAPIAMAFAPCQFDTSGATQTISLQSNSTYCAGTSVPGGFGWLATSDPTVCSTTVTAGSTVSDSTIYSGSTGASISAACNAMLTQYLNKTILIPVFSNSTGTGSGSTFTIQGFVAFTLLGWSFPSYSGGISTTNKSIIGQFVKFVSVADGYTLGGTNFGASVVQLSQ